LRNAEEPLVEITLTSSISFSNQFGLMTTFEASSLGMGTQSRLSSSFFSKIPSM
jgi:hypothetical protein